MRNYIQLLGIIFCGFCHSLIADVLPSEIKNTYNIFTEDFKDLSPLPGIVWYKGGVLENLSELSGYDHPVAKVTKELFHRVDQANYKPSTSNTAVASYLKPNDLGRLAMRLIYLRSIGQSTLTVKAQEAKLKEIIESAVKRENRRLANNDAKILRRRINQLSKLLVDALFKSGKDISVFKTLGATAFVKSRDRADLLQFILGEGQELSVIKELALDNVFSNARVFTDSLEQERWLQDVYAPNDAPTEQFDDYELLVYRMLLTTTGSWLDPYLTSSEIAVLKTGVQFPCCGETSLLNLIRILFSNADTLTIDLDLLKAVVGNHEPKSRSAEVIAFFSTKVPSMEDPKKVLDFLNLSDLRTKEARDAWAEVSSNIDCNSLEYRVNDSNGRYNISGENGYQNGKRFLRKLLNVDTIEELIQKINLHRGSLNFAVEANLDDGGRFGTMAIRSLDRGSFLWNFSPSHFALFTDLGGGYDFSYLAKLINQNQPFKDLTSLIAATDENQKFSVIFAPEHLPYAALMNRMRTDDAMYLYLNNLSVLYKKAKDAYDQSARKLFASLFRNSFLVNERIIADDTKTRLFKYVVPETLFDEQRESISKRMRAKEKRKFKIAAVCHFAPMKEINEFLSMEDHLDEENNSLLNSALEFHCPKGALDYLLANTTEEDLERKNNNGDTPLHIALTSGLDADRFFCMLEKSGRKARNATNNNGINLLSRALASYTDESLDKARIIYKLLEEDILEDHTLSGVVGLSRNMPPIKKVLILKSDLSIPVLKRFLERLPKEVLVRADVLGNSALHSAIREKLPQEVINILIDALGIDFITTKNRRGDTPIVLYAKYARNDPMIFAKLLKLSIQHNLVIDQNDGYLLFLLAIQENTTAALLIDLNNLFRTNSVDISEMVRKTLFWFNKDRSLAILEVAHELELDNELQDTLRNQIAKETGRPRENI